MNQLLKRMALISALIVLAALVVYSISARFQQPELTETQLFMEHWHIVLPMSLSIVGLLWVAGSERKRK